MGSEHNRPLGPVVGHTPALKPSSDTTLSGRYVTLVGMSADHIASLYPHVSGPENAYLWDYMSSGPFHDMASYRAVMEAQISRPDMVFFAIVSTGQPTTTTTASGGGGGGCATDNVVGYASYMNISTAHRSVEVGHVMFSPALQRTPAATEAMYLMARHAFEDLGYRRYEWKCDGLNAASRAAARRLGFAPEGVFRQHMVVKGRSRDTAWFAMTDGDWPTVKEAFDGWLDPSNFDGDGVQRMRLEAFRRK